MKSCTPRVIAVLVVAVGALAVSAGSAAADTPVTVNGGWLGFDTFPPPPEPATGNPYTFTSNKPMILEVTDAFCAGDVFHLTDGGKKLGDTNFVKPIGPCSVGFPLPPVYISDPDKAYASKQFSHGTWTLQPGSHTIRITEPIDPFGGGTGAFLRVDTRKTKG